MPDILVVDDEYPIRESIDMFLSEKGYRVHTAASFKEAMTLFDSRSFAVVILDIRLPDGNGLDALSRMHVKEPLSKIIMVTAFQDMETTIEAMKRGAYDYLHKPLDADELEKTVADAANSYSEDWKIADDDEGPPVLKDTEIIGKSAVMKNIFKMIGILCQNRATGLIMGETGTGKELVARRIHLSGPDSRKPFVVFDCSAVVDTLLESELFGHERGAFTGAVDSRSGKIEQAQDGTLFLDEIGELPLNLQGKLLGFLERQEYSRVGGKKILHSRCRIIAATNKNLEQMVKEKKFRDDLFFRLKVVAMTLPPLRKRRGDIPELVNFFLKKSRFQLGLKPLTLQDGCMGVLKHYHWSGNVRELENLIVSASIQSRGSVILLDTIKALFTKKNVPGSHRPYIDLSLAEVEKHHVSKVLSSVDWNRTRAADILKISLPTLRKKIKKYHLSPEKK